VELLQERCAALDIGKKDLKACVRTPSLSGKRSRRQEIRTFATTTNALLELRDWLVAEKVTLVGDGGYWGLLAGCVLPDGGLPECDLGQCCAR
jgi:transposase